MTTTEKAGKCTKDIGTMRTTTTATGETTSTIATVMITTNITTDHYYTSSKRPSLGGLPRFQLVKDKRIHLGILEALQCDLLVRKGAFDF